MSIVPASKSENFSQDPVAEGLSSMQHPGTSSTASASLEIAAIDAVTLYLPGFLKSTFQEADSSALSQNPMLDWPSFSSTLNLAAVQLRIGRGEGDRSGRVRLNQRRGRRGQLGLESAEVLSTRSSVPRRSCKASPREG